MAAFDSNAGGFGDEEEQKKTQAYPPSSVSAATPASTQATTPYNDTPAATPSTPASQPSGFGEQPQASAAAATTPAASWGDGQGGSYSWNTGAYGAEGAWSNGYNPQWEHHEAPIAPPAAAPQAASVPVGAQPAAQAAPRAHWPRRSHRSPSAPYQQQPQQQSQQPDPRSDSIGDDWAKDPRSNPNNTMSVYEDPVTHQQYSDFDNPALRVTPGGSFVRKDSTTTWDPTAIYTDPSSQFYIPPGDPRWNA